jgi:hypothetical protein
LSIPVWEPAGPPIETLVKVAPVSMIPKKPVNRPLPFAVYEPVIFRTVPASEPSRIVIVKEGIEGVPVRGFPLTSSNPKAFALALS